MTATEAIPVRIWTHGAVPEDAQELAAAKVHAGLRHVARPVLSARVTLTMSADPAVPFPAGAQTVVDVNGRIVRAEGAGQARRHGIELIADRRGGRARPGGAPARRTAPNPPHPPEAGPPRPVELIRRCHPRHPHPPLARASRGP